MHVNCLNSVRIEGTNKSDTKSDHAALLTDVKMKVFKLGLNAGQKKTIWYNKGQEHLFIKMVQHKFMHMGTQSNILNVCVPKL